MNGSTTPASLPGLSVPQLASLLAAPARWEILQELGKGEALPVAELAQRTGRTAAATGKNLRLLRQLGVAVVGFDLADYFQLLGAWYLSDPASDIDGNGIVDLDDYFLLASHWLEVGDAP